MGTKFKHEILILMETPGYHFANFWVLRISDFAKQNFDIAMLDKSKISFNIGHKLFIP